MTTLPATLFLILFVSAVFAYCLFLNPSLLGEIFGEPVAEQPRIWSFSLWLGYLSALFITPIAAGYLAMRVLEEFKMAILAGFLHGLISGFMLSVASIALSIPFGLDPLSSLGGLLILPLLAAIVSSFLGFIGAWRVDREIRTKPNKLKISIYIISIGLIFFGLELTSGRLERGGGIGILGAIIVVVAFIVLILGHYKLPPK
jgi:hypothetical protein